MKFEDIRNLLCSATMLVIGYKKLVFKKPEDIPHDCDNYTITSIYAPYRTDPIFNNHIVINICK